MERRPFRGPGLSAEGGKGGERGPDRIDHDRPDLGRLLTDLGVSVPIRHAVSGIVSGPASAIQARALSDAVQGRNLLAVAPTGSGKTLVFAVGLVHRIAGSPSIPGRPRALVVSPTRELALQTDEVLGAVGAGAGLRIASFVGGQPIAKDKRTLVAPVDVAVGTPGRLVALLRSGALAGTDIQIVVLDEVDQLLDVSFRDQTAALLDRCEGAILMSTTATADIDLEAGLRRRRPDLRIHRVPVGVHDADRGGPGIPETLLGDPAASSDPPTTADGNNPRHLIVLTTSDPEACATTLAARCRRALFFVARRDAVEPLRAAIAARGVPASGVSGSASPTRRATAFGDLAAGTVRVLVTTDLAGRGLDLENIGHIIHVGPPHSLQDLVHRSGRTGRGDTAAGTVAAVVRPADAARMVDQARQVGMTVDQVNADTAASRSRLDTLFGAEIAVPRQRRQPAPRDKTRRPSQSRVHRPKKKRRT